jgi:hypothetical protein
MSKPSFSKEDLESLGLSLFDFLEEEGFIDGDGDEWEALIDDFAKKIYEHYDRKV